MSILVNRCRISADVNPDRWREGGAEDSLDVPRKKEPIEARVMRISMDRSLRRVRYISPRYSLGVTLLEGSVGEDCFGLISTRGSRR